MTVSFSRYLDAKAHLDTESLHQPTWKLLSERLGSRPPVRILDIGAGTGVMLERLFRAGLIKNAAYWALESFRELLSDISRRLERLVKEYPDAASGLVLYPIPSSWVDFSRGHQQGTVWDLVTATAFLGQVDATLDLGTLAPLTRPGSILYASLNFDGLTQWYPWLPEDDGLMEAYHAEKTLTGRLLMNTAVEHGFRILSAGPSDWVVLPGSQTEGVRDFLVWILETIGLVLGTRSEGWLSLRRSQAESGTLGLRVSNWDLLLERA